MKNLRPFFLFIAVTLMFMSVRDASACTCMWGGPFLKVAPRAGLIIRGRILSHSGKGGAGTPTEMEVRVLETLSGTASGEVIIVSGDNGILCRPYVSGFPVDTEWVLALQPAVKSFQDKGDYSISVCGEYWLRVSGDRVSGKISDAKHGRGGQTLSLDELRQRLARKQRRTPSGGQAPGRRAAR